MGILASVEIHRWGLTIERVLIRW